MDSTQRKKTHAFEIADPAISENEVGKCTNAIHAMRINALEDNVIKKPNKV